MRSLNFLKEKQIKMIIANIALLAYQNHSEFFDFDLILIEYVLILIFLLYPHLLIKELLAQLDLLLVNVCLDFLQFRALVIDQLA